MNNSGGKKSGISGAMLRNKKIMKTLEEGLNAPIGSTKREKARRLASILRKTTAKFDGQGGPGYGNPNFAMDIRGQQKPQKENKKQEKKVNQMVIFPSITKPQGPVVFDGQGGPGFGNSSMVSPFGGQTSGSTANNVLSRTNNAFAPNTITSSLTPSTGPFNAAQHGSLVQGFKLQGIPDNLLNKNQSVTTTPTPTSTAAATQGQQTTTPQTPSTPTGGPQPQPQTQQQYTAPTSSTKTGVQTGGAATGGNFAAPQPGSNLYSRLSSAVQGNMGATGFAMNVMNDVNLLRQLMPGVPDTELPVGASLAQQVADIKERLKEEYNLDGLRNQLSNKITQGVSLTNDLNNYIRGKDEYLNKVDSMLESAKDKYLTLDTANPAVNYTMNRYMQYLNTLKGAQNQRYADFVKSSVDQYNNELTALNDRLKIAETTYSQELQDQTALTQDDYNRIYTALTEMYTEAKDAPRRQLELDVLRAELAKANASLVDNASGYMTDEKWLNQYKDFAAQNILFDKDSGTLRDVEDLDGALATWLSNGQSGAIGFNNAAAISMQKDITASSSLDDLLEKTQKYGEMLAAYTRGNGGIYGGGIANNMMGSTAQKASEVLQNTGAIDNVRNLVADMTLGPRGLTTMFMRGQPISAEQAKNKYSQLPAALIDAIAAQRELSAAAGDGQMSVRNDNGDIVPIAQLGDTQLANKIGELISLNAYSPAITVAESILYNQTGE